MMNLRARALLLGAVVFMGGCAAPGMHMDGQASSQKSSSEVQPVLKEITPQLLREESDARDVAFSQYFDAQVKPLLAEPMPYRIGAGDVLDIELLGLGQTGLVSGDVSQSKQSSSGVGSNKGASAGGYLVDLDGKIRLPYVGLVKLADCTIAEAHRVLVAGFSKYLKNPEVALRVQVFRSQRVFLGGEVGAPGVFPITDTALSLPEVLSAAGGVKQTGDPSSIRLVRNGTSFVIDWPRITEKGINLSKIQMSGGDVLRVPGRDESRVFVLGEVMRRQAVPLKNGRLSLNEALGEAGGLNPFSSDARQVYVIRSSSDTHPLVYHLNASSPVAMALAENFEMRAKDVVFVEAASMINWNRVITQFLPTSNMLLNSRNLKLFQ